MMSSASVPLVHEQRKRVLTTKLPLETSAKTGSKEKTVIVNMNMS
jgi:hypothetical protein